MSRGGKEKLSWREAGTAGVFVPLNGRWIVSAPQDAMEEATSMVALLSSEGPKRGLARTDPVSHQGSGNWRRRAEEGGGQE